MNKLMSPPPMVVSEVIRLAVYLPEAVTVRRGSRKPKPELVRIGEAVLVRRKAGA